MDAPTPVTSLTRYSHANCKLLTLLRQIGHDGETDTRRFRLTHLR